MFVRKTHYSFYKLIHSIISRFKLTMKNKAHLRKNMWWADPNRQGGVKGMETQRLDRP